MRRLRSGWGWRIAGWLVALLVLLPLASLALIASQGSPGLLVHIAATVLPSALADTAMLLAGVGAMVAVLGCGMAWLVTAYDFPGRRTLEWALLLPLAVPSYIVAYAYLDILHPVGPVQAGLRTLLGYASPREFRLPDIRSMAGCILLLGLVLYPYVYLTVRAMFLTQAASLVEVARTLGARRPTVFFAVALPLARPAIAVGTSLALMEALNDIGASEFLGVRTMTVAVYSTWISRHDLPGAAQLALAMLAIVIALILCERWARRNRRYTIAAQRPRLMVPQRLAGWRGWLACCLCFMPVGLGFLAPAAYLVIEAYRRWQFAGISSRIWSEAANTVTISALTTLLVLACGLVVVYGARLRQGRASSLAARLSTIGYAVPGTILAIGLLGPIGTIDGYLSDAARSLFGLSIGLALLGSGAALVYAYATRFMAISTGGVEAGFSRISPSLDQAARSLGRSATGAFRDVHLPLSKTALAAAGLLIFVDCMKELPATLLLRPLNFETLATRLYGEAARGTYEEAAIAALIIVLIGMLPVALLARMGRSSR